MNKARLRELAKAIQQTPDRFDMDNWHHSINKNKSVYPLDDAPPETWFDCNTTHCIAGLAQVIFPDRNIDSHPFEDAQRLLGLNNEQARRLFYAEFWPKGYSEYNCTAEQAAARIEHFIKTDGAE